MRAMPTATTTAARLMGTGTSKRGVALAALTLALAGCGAAASGSGGGTAASRTASSGTAGSPPAATGTAGSPTAPGGAFSWLRPEAPPANWKVAAIPSGAAMVYPPNWKLQHGDAGTATAALTGADDQILGYLNLTPRQGSETLANWSSFRVAHDADEGDKAVRRLAVGTGLQFRNGHGACVKDAYLTITHARYIEVACLVKGPRTEAVIVAAAPPEAWTRESATLERAIEGVRT